MEKQKQTRENDMRNFFNMVTAIHKPPCLLLISIDEENHLNLEAGASNLRTLNFFSDMEAKKDYFG